MWFPELFKDVQFYTSAASNGYGALESICLAWGILRADRLDYNPGGTAAVHQVRPYSIDWPSNHEYSCPFQHSGKIMHHLCGELQEK